MSIPWRKVMSENHEMTRYERGLAKALELGGQADPQTVASVGDLGRYLVEFVFGDIYSRPGMNLREREMVAVAVLLALGREPQLRVHLKAALHIGITRQELEEVVLQTVPYVGFPLALSAMQVLAQLKSEESAEP
jgi:4-carboxymuconolactone decarboxylase